MDLGSWSNTDGTSIGDSRYTTDAQPRSTTANLSPCPDPTFSSLPALPLTISYRSLSPVDMASLSGLEDIRTGNAVPLKSSPSSSHGSVTSSSDSDEVCMVDGCRIYGLVRGKKTYDSLDEVAGDIQCLGKQQNNCLDEIIAMKDEIKLLKAVIARLEGDSVTHEAELMVNRGEPMWGSRETIRESVRVEAVKRINGGMTPSPPPAANVDAPSSSCGKQVSFDESSATGFVEVRKKRTRGRKANKDTRGRATDPVIAAAPAPVPLPV